MKFIKVDNRYLNIDEIKCFYENPLMNNTTEVDFSEDMGVIVDGTAEELMKKIEEAEKENNQ